MTTLIQSPPMADPLDFAPLARHARPLFDRPLCLMHEAAASLGVDAGALGAHSGGDGGAEGQPPYRLVDGVATIPIRGALVNRDSWLTRAFGITTYQGIAAALRQAAADPLVRRIVLDTDSPGGEAAGAMETADLVAEAAKRKPVVAFVNSLAASAAYWIASGASEIVAMPSATLGSIGVVWLHLDHSAAFAAAGVKPTLLHAGAQKIDGVETHPLDPKAKARIQAQLDDVYNLFTASVGKHRPRLGAPGAKATEAAIFIGEKAVAAGLADRTAASPAPLAQRSRWSGNNPERALPASSAAELPARAAEAPTSRGGITKPRDVIAEPAGGGAAEAITPADPDRIAAILQAPEAKERPRFAQRLAFHTTLNAAIAIESLALAGKERSTFTPSPPPPPRVYRSMADANAAIARGEGGFTLKLAKSGASPRTHRSLPDDECFPIPTR
jgi:capsid assembly protease